MNPCCLAYIPPPNIPGSAQFLNNLRRFKTSYPLVLFSDHPYGDGVLKMHKSPEIIKGAKYVNGAPNKWALNNLVFLTGLRVVGDSYSHFLYLEADCRVNGDDWDGVVFEEFMQRNPGAIAAGTFATYNVNNRDIEFSRAWHRWMVENGDAQFPITAYGGNGASEKHEPAVFPNGALAIYEVAWLREQFGRENTVKTAAEITAFDYEIGRRLVRQFGPDVFRGKILHMDSVYSSYGDVQTTEEQRQNLLVSKKVAAVHQIKSVWRGPDREEPSGVDTGEPVIEQSGNAATPVANAPVAETADSDPKVEIFIVSYAPDIPYLRYNLKSIEKFCTGFSGVTVLVPKQHIEQFEALQGEYEFTLKSYMAPADKGKWHIAHQLQKCFADKWCPGANYILHTDSDCVFTRETTPGNFFCEGRPILCIEPFEKCGQTWKKEIDAALKIDAKFETMRRHGAIHPADIYGKFREYLTKIQGKKMDKWWMEQKADYPWGVTEFNFLGNFVNQIQNDARYSFIDISQVVPPESPIFQFWSHSRPEKEQEFPGGGKGVPMDKLRELGLTD